MVVTEVAMGGGHEGRAAVNLTTLYHAAVDNTGSAVIVEHGEARLFVRPRLGQQLPHLLTFVMKVFF